MIKYILCNNPASVHLYKLDTESNEFYRFHHRFVNGNQKGWIYMGKWNGKEENLKNIITEDEMKRIVLDKLSLV